MVRIRPAIAADYEALAAIANLIRPEPVCAKEILEQDQRHQADTTCQFHRLVAVTGADLIVGYGLAERANWEPEGHWTVSAGSHPEHRGQGVASAILAAAEQIARDAGATRLIAWVLGTDDPSFEWAQRRGYALRRQRTESYLDLTTFDISRFAGAVERVRESGLGLAMYVDRDVPESVMRSVYELDLETSPDVPMWDADDTFPTYEQYVHDFMADPSPRVMAVAMDGDRAVGMSSLWFPRIPGRSAVTGYTGVLRTYRGRGIALAVKLMTIAEALRRGTPRLRTNNDPDNPPMLAINVKLGYQFVPGPRQLEKLL